MYHKRALGISARPMPQAMTRPCAAGANPGDSHKDAATRLALGRREQPRPGGAAVPQQPPHAPPRGCWTRGAHGGFGDARRPAFPLNTNRASRGYSVLGRRTETGSDTGPCGLRTQNGRSGGSCGPRAPRAPRRGQQAALLLRARRCRPPRVRSVWAARHGHARTREPPAARGKERGNRRGWVSAARNRSSCVRGIRNILPTRCGAGGHLRGSPTALWGNFFRSCTSAITRKTHLK